LWPSGTNLPFLHPVLGFLLSFLRRYKHPRFIDVTCRFVKSDDAPDDMMSVRFFRFYDAPTDEDEAEV